MTPRVTIDPIDEQIDCDEDETVLDAAFRHGYNLVYGCREGQCSACKCFLLEGEVTLKPYSTFALSDTEESQGYTLLCRAMPDTDLVVELLHYDPDNYRLDVPIRDGVATVTSIERLTHDIVGLKLDVSEPADFDFIPGQYVDLWVPGSEERRSFSMANAAGEGIELMIKCYPGGRFSALLDGELKPGDELKFTGPFGSFRLRESENPILLVAGGSGMAPVLSLLRQLAGAGSERPIRFFYGARTEADLFYVDEIAVLGESLPHFEFCAVLSEAGADSEWAGERGFVHEAAGRYLDAVGAETVETYTCGPPPMVDALTELLTERFSIDESRIFFDKFTTAAGATDEKGSTAT
ncbi:MAG: 2Fe-2S iron-sulfur cluster binding domain-containing protein [Solirubrobacterales bacterium]